MHNYDRASKKINRLCKGSIVIKYTLVGIIFGFMFPIMAIIFEIYFVNLNFTFESVKSVHRLNPLLFMIDTAPLFLGIFSGIAGNNQSNSCKANKSLNKLLTYDELTGIYTRVTGKNLLKKLIENLKDDMNITLYYIDLDNFKIINDTLGHIAGDIVLKSIANRLNECTAGNGFAMRLGGDEFLLVIENKYSKEELLDIAYMINHYITIPVIIENKLVEITGSIGISSYPSDASTMDELLFASDAAMYDAKKAKSKCAYYDQKYKEDYHSNLMTQANILTSIDKSHFQVHYQPIVDKETKVLIGLDTVILWNSQNIRYFYPRDFIRTNENDDLIYQLSLWSFDAICEDYKALESNNVKGLFFSISVDGTKLDDLKKAYGICKANAIHKDSDVNIRFDILKTRQIINYKEHMYEAIPETHYSQNYTTVYSVLNTLHIKDLDDLSKLNSIMKFKNEYSTICIKENNSQSYTKYVSNDKSMNFSSESFNRHLTKSYDILSPRSINDIISDIKADRYKV